MAHPLLSGPPGITDRAGAGDKLYSELHGELYQFSFASRRWFPLALRARRSAAAPEARWPQGVPLFKCPADCACKSALPVSACFTLLHLSPDGSAGASACQVVGLLSTHVTFLWSGG